jgi:hypothetical protein
MSRTGTTENLVDVLSKELATAISRRATFQILSKGMLTLLVSAVGMRKLWGLTLFSAAAATNDDSYCPSCGNCQLCDIESGKCGLKCSNHCEAALLCKNAVKYKPYLVLQSFILQQQQTQTGPPSAIVSAKENKILASSLVTSYSSATFTFELIYVQAGSGPQAYALQFLDGIVQFGYTINGNGDIARVTPPTYSPPELVEDSQDDFHFVPQHASNDEQPTSILCNACKFLCGGNLSCLKKAVILSAPEEYALWPALVIFVLCKLVSSKCKQVCDEWLCKCPTGRNYCGSSCCGPCESCVNGECQGSCTESEECVDDGCTVSWPPGGNQPCGSYTCRPDQYCCGNQWCCGPAWYQGVYCCSKNNSFCCCLASDCQCGSGCNPRDCTCS